MNDLSKLDLEEIEKNTSKGLKKFVDKLNNVRRRIAEKHSPNRQWQEIDKTYNPGKAFTKAFNSESKEK